MGRRIPIENDDPPGDDEERPEDEESSIAPSHSRMKKAYLADELEFPMELPTETPPHAPQPPEGEEGTEERLLRLAAEFANFKKRMERERAQAQAYANEELLERLLPVVDNLERALAAADPGGAQDGLVAGIDLTMRELLELLRREGVEPIDALEQPFDPTVHEAISTAPSADVPEGRVITQVEKGYRYKDRILRPAKVIVSSGPP